MPLPSFKGQSLRKTLLITAAVAAVLVCALAFFPGGTGKTGLLPISKPGAPALPDPEPFSEDLPARGKFLVASPDLADPRFQETVVLLLDYSAEGAAGIIINRPSKVPIAELLPSVPGLKERDDVVYYGGPVEGQRVLMLIRSKEKPEDSGRVFGNVYVSASMVTLERMIGSHKTAKELRMYAGYAGWMAGQLDWELSRGDWLIVGADAFSIFEKKSSEIWRELFQRGSAIQVWNRGSIPASGLL
jgi:putative transcriptional regulator